MVTEFSNKELGITNTSSEMNKEFRGLSTDTKPSANNGDVFFEIDTSKAYMYNGATSTWVEL